MDVLSFLSDPAAWRAELAAFPTSLRDVYFTHGYHHLHEVNGDGTPMVLTARAGDRVLLISGLRTPVPGGDGFDLQTPNGYGGPLATEPAAADPNFLREAWVALRTRCVAEKV